MAENICLFCGKKTEAEDIGDLRPWSCEGCNESWHQLPLRVRVLIRILLERSKLEPQEAIALIKD